MRKILFLLVNLLLSVDLFAQKSVSTKVEMADQMRADGKIWVVFAVISVIFIGIIAFLVSLERKITKLEKQLKK